MNYLKYLVEEIRTTVVATVDDAGQPVTAAIDIMDYAVSIHKAQGLEYDSVKVIIPSNNAEKITHGIFYTAITRAKTNLKIYWSSETMQDIVKGFATDESKRKSLKIVKSKLEED